MTENRSDDHRAAGVLTDDPEALLNDLRRTARWVAYGLPGWSAEEARKEVVQRAYLRVLEKHQEQDLALRLRDPSKKGAYITKLAVNVWRSFRREVLREDKRRMPDRSPPGDGDDEQEEGEQYDNARIDRDPVARACEDRETIYEVLKTIVVRGERHSRLAGAVLRDVLRGMLNGVPNADLARQLHLTEHQLRNLKNRVISRVLAESFPDLFTQYTRRGPKRGKKGKSGPRRRPPGGETEDSGADSFSEAATRVAASHRVGRDRQAPREMLASRFV